MTDLATEPSSATPFSSEGSGTSALRVLFLVHNHPEFCPGGAEIYALELHRAMQSSHRFESLLLAAAPPGFRREGAGRAFYRVRPEDPSELAWAVADFDDFYFTSRDKTTYTRDFRALLRDFRPDVVHVQHTLRLGLEVLTEIRRTCPQTPIVYTLHEFLPICFSRGIMLRQETDERCARASPWRCHGCFPNLSPEDFFLREQFVKAQLGNVDLFLAPSLSLRERYIDWGIAPERIRFHEYGRRIPTPLPTETADTRRFTFFGQVMRHKGTMVLLRAFELMLRRGGEATLYIDGANMAFDGAEYVAELMQTMESFGGRVVFRGSYSPEELPERLENVGWVVVPSIWWENSPLVIQEAFMYGRPVICSDIGGMAEKVSDSVNGLHFRAGDSEHLAEVLARAAGDDELWRQLRAGIPRIFSLAESLEQLELLYGELRQSRRASISAVPRAAKYSRSASA